MKKANISICILLVILLSATWVGGASAAEIKLVLDNKYVYTDTPPSLVDGRVLVPVRAIFDALGGTVDWNPDKQEVFGYKGAKRVWLYIDSTRAYSGNREESQLDVPAQIIDGRAMVPLRFIAESLGCEVNWDEDNQIVFLKSSKVSSAGDVFNLIKPTMVRIETEEKRGSGFFITEDTVLTNAHVVTGAYEIKVKAYNNRYYTAVVDRIDIDVDLAILKVQAPGEKFKYIYQRLSSKDIKEGQDVVAIGHPFGLENTVSTGIVSGFREEDGIKYIQMTAPISPGNSGGPLITLDGEVVGINTWQKVNGQNLNFAVPLEYYDQVKNGKPLVLDGEITKFIKARSDWYSKLKGVDEDLDAMTKSGKEHRFADCSSRINNHILPRLEASRQLAKSFTTRNSDVRECADLWVELMDRTYSRYKSLSRLCDMAANDANVRSSLTDFFEDLDSGLAESSASPTEYDIKCIELWEKYYKQSDNK
ncbi:MAG: trypsin-like serine protease [Firmicutes bacterium]|nr:trypsin-like serine protease [Bacillota bacterium]